MSGWHLYLLRCRDGSLYAGIATDVERRFREHAAGSGAKYTRSHPPDRLLASRPYPDRASALRAEHALKRLPRARKLAWLLDPARGDACAPPPGRHPQRKRCRSSADGTRQASRRPNQR